MAIPAGPITRLEASPAKAQQEVRAWDLLFVCVCSHSTVKL